MAEVDRDIRDYRGVPRELLDLAKARLDGIDKTKHLDAYLQYHLLLRIAHDVSTLRDQMQKVENLLAPILKDKAQDHADFRGGKYSKD